MEDNTFENVFQLMLLWIQKFGFDLSALKAALPKWKTLKNFMKGIQVMARIDATLEKAARYVTTNKKNTLNHKNRVEAKEVVDTSKIDAVSDWLCRYGIGFDGRSNQ